jgi:hypothetical protein
MTMYWIYDLSNGLLGVLTVVVFVGLSVAGLFACRPLMRRLLGESSCHNDVVSYFFAAVGVFYGLALGLIAIATWEDYTGADDLVSKEAAALGRLYLDLDGFPQPLRLRLEDDLRAYARFVIEREWPAHRRGEVLAGGSAMLEGIENQIMTFDPTREREKIVQAGGVRSMDALVELRDLRIQAVDTGLPAALWSVVILGAVLTIAMTYMFWIENIKLHAVLVGSLAAFLAMLVFLTAAMDNPFRGEFSVSPDAFQTILDTVMNPRSG